MPPRSAKKAETYRAVSHSLKVAYREYHETLYQPFAAAIAIPSDDLAITSANLESTIRRPGHLAIFAAATNLECEDGTTVTGVGACSRDSQLWSRWLTRRTAYAPHTQEDFPKISDSTAAGLAAVLFALEQILLLPTAMDLPADLVAPAPPMTEKDIERLDRKFHTGTRFGAIEQIQEVEPTELLTEIGSVAIYTDNKVAIDMIQTYEFIPLEQRGLYKNAVWVASIRTAATILTDKAVRLTFHYVPRNAGVEGHEIATRLSAQGMYGKKFSVWSGYPLGTTMREVDELFHRDWLRRNQSKWKSDQFSDVDDEEVRVSSDDELKNLSMEVNVGSAASEREVEVEEPKQERYNLRKRSKYVR